jgi:serine O-acetyltransferase
MSLNDWLNENVPKISKDLEDLKNKHFCEERIIGFAGKESVYNIIEHLRTALFPGVYEKQPIDEDGINIIIGNSIRIAALQLNNLIVKTLRNKCDHQGRPGCNECKEIANEAVKKLISRLPEIRRILQTDIQAAYEGDPAAMSTEEIILSYPSIDAVSIYRIAHELYEMEIPIIPRIMTEYAHQRTGIDIHPGAHIGEYFFIDHGTGVVIGETCYIGNHVKIYQGVTLGAKSFKLDEHGNPVKGIKRHPDIQDNVVIYAGATILGGETVIGHDSIIGGNVWLIESVPPYSIVYNGQPLPVIKQKNPEKNHKKE